MLPPPPAPRGPGHDPRRADRILTLSDAQLDRYARHLVLPEIGGAGQRRLLGARVCVVGAGGLGATLLPHLAAAGVGRIRLIDDDRVSLSNLQRQTLYTTADIGRPKVEVAAERLHALNPDVGVEAVGVRLTPATAEAMLNGCDLVADGCDNFATRLAVSDAAVRLGLPLVSAALGRFDGQLGVFRGHHADQPCYRCLVGPDPRAAERSCADAGVLGALAGLMGAAQALEVVRELTGFGDSLVGRLLLWDALSLRPRVVRVAKDPACPACGATASPAAAVVAM